MAKEKYVLYVDGYPQKDRSDSLETLEEIAEKSYINSSNFVEILTTDDFLLADYYDNFSRSWVSKGK